MAPATPEQHPDFLRLFKAEIQNRAFALLAVGAKRSTTSAPDDALLYEYWVEFEILNQRRYAPIAKKYRISQEPGWSAHMRATLASGAARFLSEKLVLKFMLRETRNYVSKLEELARVAPLEDKNFFDYVVTQEELQVDVLSLCVEGKAQEAAGLLARFIEKHGDDRAG